MYEDWGERAERWAGIRSEVVDMRGWSVHLLRADGPSDGRSVGPVQLLVHGLGGAATNWLEVIPALAKLGPVVAPDLPGFGRTQPRRSKATRIRANAGFLRAFATTLGIERAIVHANSMGGLLATFLAAKHPDLVERLVLLDPALPGPRRQLYRLSRQTLLTFAPFAVPRLGRVLLGRMYASRTAEQLWQANQFFVHGDPSRIRPELAQVVLDNIRMGQQMPWRLEGLVTAAESVIASQIGTRQAWRAVDAITAPTLLLWGDRDQLIGRPVVDGLVARRPDWDLHVFEGAGHAAQMEVPDDYLDVVVGWLEGDRPAARDTDRASA